MQTNAVNNGQQAGAAGAVAGGNPAAGNEQLTQAFDTAIQQAQQTLAISTEKGAQLYALKQRPQ
ncbi:MAG: hypothetical protein R3D34_17370 [Nitratireductor sp.]